MFENNTTCQSFGRWLLEADATDGLSEWSGHVERCPDCEGQWLAHRMLTAGLADRAVPELSTGFEVRLRRRLTSEIDVRPLRGWKLAAMAAYVVVGLGGLAWALRGVPLPAIDPSSPWVLAGALLAAPWTFLLAIAASRWMPRSGPPRGLRLLTI